MHTDMEMWNEVRRKVLVEGASKRSIRREYRIGSETLAKILANPEPPGYRLSAPRHRSRSTRRSGFSSDCATSTATRAASLR